MGGAGRISSAWTRRRSATSFERPLSDRAVNGQAAARWLSRDLMTGNTRRLLVDEGFTNHMDDYSDDKPFWDAVDGKPILILPYAIDSNDMKMWTDPSYTPADWLQYAIDSFEWLYREGADQPRMMSLGVHLRIIGRPGRIGYSRNFSTKCFATRMYGPPRDSRSPALGREEPY